MSMQRPKERLVFFLMIITGLSIVSILIGLIADAVSSGMDALTDGNVKVVEKNHTIILGWNDGTPRVITQLACLRKIYKQEKKKSWCQRIFFCWCWRKKSDPESPVSCGTIVVMNNTVEVEDMKAAVVDAFDSAGLGGSGHTSGTLLGRDVIFKKGDPCVTHDLERVAAQHASSVCVMLSEVDDAELAVEETENGDPEENGACLDACTNSATLRCLLALRHVLGPDLNKNLRVVVQAPEELFSLLRSLKFWAPAYPNSSNLNAGSVDGGTGGGGGIRASIGRRFSRSIGASTDSGGGGGRGGRISGSLDSNGGGGRNSGKQSYTDCLYPQDLTLFASGLFFGCAPRPFLSQVFAELLDAQGPGIHSRPASELRAGPDFKKGWFVGKAQREAVLSHSWSNGIVVGVAPAVSNMVGGTGVAPAPGEGGGRARMMGGGDGSGLVNGTKKNTHAHTLKHSSIFFS